MKICCEAVQHPNVGNTGNGLCLPAIQTASCPPLCHGVLGQQIQLLGNGAVGVLLSQQYRLLLLNSRQIQKIPAGMKRIHGIGGFADGGSGKQHQKRAGIQHFIQPLPVLLIVFPVHR